MYIYRVAKALLLIPGKVAVCLFAYVSSWCLLTYVHEIMININLMIVLMIFLMTVLMIVLVKQ